MKYLIIAVYFFAVMLIVGGLFAAEPPAPVCEDTTTLKLRIEAVDIQRRFLENALVDQAKLTEKLQKELNGYQAAKDKKKD